MAYDSFDFDNKLLLSWHVQVINNIITNESIGNARERVICVCNVLNFIFLKPDLLGRTSAFYSYVSWMSLDGINT